MAKDGWTVVRDDKANSVMANARRHLVEVNPSSQYLGDTTIRDGIFAYARGSRFEIDFFGELPRTENVVGVDNLFSQSESSPPSPPVHRPGTPLGAAYAFRNYVNGEAKTQSGQGRFDFGVAGA